MHRLWQQSREVFLAHRQHKVRPEDSRGPNGSVTTVESAKSLRDDTWVTLRGNIVERISDDLYVFKDASGTINVDIDHKRWNGVTVTPKDTVEIQGEVDKDWNSVEIDVKQIRKVNP